MALFDIAGGVKAKQQQVVLDALCAGPLSTVEARERLGVLHAAGRVMELRKQGHDIETQRATRFDAEGRPHSCAVYVLHARAQP